mmetsp:Transcript_16237/g.41437  ORF Transcript_16237/g.41437 Transcript_16237/m.41437 type:complete len:398 (+) Transcript_16237:2675-3868(+)
MSSVALRRLYPSASASRLSVSLAKSVSSAPVCVGVMSSHAIPFLMLNTSPVHSTPSPTVPVPPPAASLSVSTRPLTATVFPPEIVASALVRPVMSLAGEVMVGAVAARLWMSKSTSWPLVLSLPLTIATSCTLLVGTPALPPAGVENRMANFVFVNFGTTSPVLSAKVTVPSLRSVAPAGAAMSVGVASVCPSTCAASKSSNTTAPGTVLIASAPSPSSTVRTTLFTKTTSKVAKICIGASLPTPTDQVSVPSAVKPVTATLVKLWPASLVSTYVRENLRTRNLTLAASAPCPVVIRTRSTRRGRVNSTVACAGYKGMSSLLNTHPLCGAAGFASAQAVLSPPKFVTSSSPSSIRRSQLFGGSPLPPLANATAQEARKVFAASPLRYRVTPSAGGSP